MKLGPRRLLAIGASVALVGLGASAAGLALTTGVADAQLQHANLVFTKTANAPTTTPIKHVVCDLRRERLLRPLFRYLSLRHQLRRRAVLRGAGNSIGERAVR